MQKFEGKYYVAVDPGSNTNLYVGHYEVCALQAAKKFNGWVEVWQGGVRTSVHDRHGVPMMSTPTEKHFTTVA